MFRSRSRGRTSCANAVGKAVGERGLGCEGNALDLATCRECQARADMGQDVPFRATSSREVLMRLLTLPKAGPAPVVPAVAGDARPPANLRIRPKVGKWAAWMAGAALIPGLVAAALVTVSLERHAPWTQSKSRARTSVAAAARMPVSGKTEDFYLKGRYARLRFRLRSRQHVRRVGREAGGNPLRTNLLQPARGAFPGGRLDAGPVR